MTYTLDAFVKDAQAALNAHAGPAGREKVRLLLEKLLTNKAFIDEAVGPAAPSWWKRFCWTGRSISTVRSYASTSSRVFMTPISAV